MKKLLIYSFLLISTTISTSASQFPMKCPNGFEKVLKTADRLRSQYDLEDRKLLIEGIEAIRSEDLNSHAQIVEERRERRDLFEEHIAELTNACLLGSPSMYYYK